jgi:glycosyltransferase involved in cell wall biosynthesis
MAVIPNPVRIPSLSESELSVERKVRIGFLGRLHPVKNVHGLLHAWSLLQEKFGDAELFIMGAGEPDYVAFLNEEIKRLNLRNVTFAGFQAGDSKYKELASLKALCVPSDFENFCMSVPESLLVNTPVIASTGTPWKILNDTHCGWWVDNSPEILAEKMVEALNLSDNETEQMGKIGHDLVLKEYAAPQVAKKMSQLYKWILGEGEKPEFVY